MVNVNKTKESIQNVLIFITDAIAAYNVLLHVWFYMADGNKK